MEDITAADQAKNSSRKRKKCAAPKNKANLTNSKKAKTRSDTKLGSNSAHSNNSIKV